MGWLFGCFKCRQKRPARCSIDLPESNKDGREASVSSSLLTADSVKESSNTHAGNSNLQAERVDMVKIPAIPDGGLAKTSSGVKKDRRYHSMRRHSSDQLLLVDELEEEINNLNKKLVEEASQASKLTNEVRHLRQFSELLDAPDAFKKALDALEHASEKGDLEENQPLLYLQSMLSRIDTTEVMVGPSLTERMDERIPDSSKEESMEIPSLDGKEQKFEGKSCNRATLASDQCDSSTVTIDEVPKLKEESKASISACQSLLEAVNIDAHKPQLVSLTKRRRSSKAFSFSGFLVFEDETEEGNTLEQAVSEHCSRTDCSVAKIIETPDTSSENLVEASKSLFAFATSSLRSGAISTGQSLPLIASESVSFLSAGSEVESCFRMVSVNGSLLKSHKAPRYLQDENTQNSNGLCSSSVTDHDQSQVDTSADSYDGFSNESSHISSSVSSRIGSSSCSNKGVNSLYVSESPPLQMPALVDKESAKRWTSSCACASQSEDMNDTVARNLCFEDLCSEVQAESASRSKGHAAGFCLQHLDSIDSSNNAVETVSDSEAKHHFKSFFSADQERIRIKETSGNEEATFVEQENLSSSHVASSDQAELTEEDMHLNKVRPCIISTTISSSLSQGESSTPAGDFIAEISTCGVASVSSPCTDTSPHSFFITSPSPQVNQNGSCSETPSTPISVNSRASIISLSKEDQRKPYCTPLKTPLTSLSQAETPTLLHSQGSHNRLGEDRPILGTVAAHWNHSASSSTKKWWDGKGIPNSTNKYKEDQQVSWHATPFEVRLERALAKQGRVFQKKLFTGAMVSGG